MLQENLRNRYSQARSYGGERLYDAKNFWQNDHHLNKFLEYGSLTAPIIGCLTMAGIYSLKFHSEMPELIIEGCAGALIGQMAYSLFLQAVGKQELDDGLFEL